MVWYRSLLAGGVLAILLLHIGVGPVSAENRAGCTLLEISSGSCSLLPIIEVLTDPDGVTLKGSVDLPG